MTNLKERLPLLFLIFISIWWAFYYQSNNALNAYGEAKSEWLYLIDGLLVLPALCFFCIKDKKEAAIKSAFYCCLIVLIGSFIIPDQSKHIWEYLELGRYFLLALFLLLELITFVTLFVAVKSTLSKAVDPDFAMIDPIKKRFGNSIVGNLLAFETRVWTYALFAKKVERSRFSGEEHFSYHQKDAAQSNTLGFIFLMLIELPLVHLLLHFTWSPLGANIISFLTILSIVYMLAEYRAMSLRPISICNGSLIVRFSLYQPLELPLTKIESVCLSEGYIPRSSRIKRYNMFGNPNIRIKLSEPLANLDSIYLGVDKPLQVLESLYNAMDKAQTCRQMQ